MGAGAGAGTGAEWLAVQRGVMEGGGGQWQWQWPILRLAAGGSVNESRAGHVWAGRRDSPAAETDATVVRLNFFCQAPPCTGQKQTQMLVASACVRVGVCVCETERALCVIRHQAPLRTHTSTLVIVYCSIPFTFHLSLPLFSGSSLSRPLSPFLSIHLPDSFYSLSLPLSPSLLHLSLCSKAGSPLQ